MGHTRIGRLNRTQQWRDVFGAVYAGADVEQMSKMVLEAASKGLNEKALSNNAAYQKAVEILVQMGAGAQTGNFVEHMKQFGVILSEKPSVQELIANVNDVIDDAMWSSDYSTGDLGENAKIALANAITSCVRMEREGELPMIPQQYDVDIFNRFGKKDNFGELTRIFISQTMAHNLNNYISQFLPNFVGHAEKVMSVQELHASYKSLNTHCYETSRVHLDYANEWLRKHHYKLKDLTPKQITKHANFLVKKMMRALKYGKD